MDLREFYNLLSHGRSQGRYCSLLFLLSHNTFTKLWLNKELAETRNSVEKPNCFNIKVSEIKRQGMLVLERIMEPLGTLCYLLDLLFEVPLTSSIASCMKVGSFSSSSVQTLPALLYDPDLTRSEGERHFPHFKPSTWVPHTLLTLLSLKSRPPSLALISCQDRCRQAETRRPQKLDFHLAFKID